MHRVWIPVGAGRFLTRAALATTLLLMAVIAAPAHADSDGYFCAGPDYLAYQFAFSHGGSKHELTVVSLRDGTAGSVALPFFQPHGMRCTETTVEMKGWKEVHRIDVTDRRKPTYRGKKSAASQGAGTYDQQNLGLWPTAQGRRINAGETLILLASGAKRPKAELRLRIRESRVPGGLKRHHETDLVLTHRGAAPTVKRLFTGSFDEPVH